MADGAQEADDDRQAKPEDIDELIAFLNQLEGVLQQVLDDGTLLPAETLDSLRGAWSETKDDLTLWRRSAVAEREGLSNENGDTAARTLKDHGLTGKSLGMKLSGWRSRLFAIGERMDRPWLRSLLRWAETIIESFTDSIPGGAGVKEFVQAVSNHLDDAEQRASSAPPAPRSADRVVPIQVAPGDRLYIELKQTPPDPPSRAD